MPDDNDEADSDEDDDSDGDAQLAPAVRVKLPLVVGTLSGALPPGESASVCSQHCAALHTVLPGPQVMRVCAQWPAWAA